MRRAPGKFGRVALGWAFASFVLVQLGTALAIEAWLPEFRDPGVGLKLRLLSRRAVTQAAGAPAIVMVGSSRVQYGLLGRDLEEQLTAACGQRPVVFNFGQAAAGPVMELLMVRRMLAAGIRPGLLLIEVLPPFLSAEGSSLELARLTPDRLYLDELPIIARPGASLWQLRSNWWQAWPVPAFSHRYAILHRTAPPLLPGKVSWRSVNHIDRWGMGVMPTPPTREQQPRLVAGMLNWYRPLLNDFRLGEPACDSLRDLLELCRKERIGAMLVLMPEGTEFKGLYTSDVWRQIEAFLHDLTREFDVPLVNARDWVADEHFSDSHHLLHAGAAEFTSRLAREHVTPSLTGSHAPHP
jgi:hypothetical protein